MSPDIIDNHFYYSESTNTAMGSILKWPLKNEIWRDQSQIDEGWDGDSNK